MIDINLILSLQFLLAVIDFILLSSFSNRIHCLSHHHFMQIHNSINQHIRSHSRCRLLDYHKLSWRFNLILSLMGILQEDHKVWHQLFSLELHDFIQNKETMLVFDIGVNSRYHRSLFTYLWSVTFIGALTLASATTEKLFNAMGVATETIWLRIDGSGSIHNDFIIILDYTNIFIAN